MALSHVTLDSRSGGSATGWSEAPGRSIRSTPMSDTTRGRIARPSPKVRAIHESPGWANALRPMKAKAFPT
jgi:hypothetical protein